MTVVELCRNNLDWQADIITKIYDPDEIVDECTKTEAAIIYRDREVAGFYTSKDGRAIIILKPSK